MKRLLMAALLAGTMFGISGPAEARDGCGRGWHRSEFGSCRPNHGANFIAIGPNGYAVPVGPQYNMFYPGYGYWNGSGYYMHREPWMGGWRYW